MDTGGIAHAHRAYGPTDMRAIMFDRPLSPLGVDQPRDLAEIRRGNPMDGRTLPGFGVAVGAGERTITRLFRTH